MNEENMTLNIKEKQNTMFEYYHRGFQTSVNKKSFFLITLDISRILIKNKTLKFVFFHSKTQLLEVTMKA